MIFIRDGELLKHPEKKQQEKKQPPSALRLGPEGRTKDEDEDEHEKARKRPTTRTATRLSPSCSASRLRQGFGGQAPRLGVFLPPYPGRTTKASKTGWVTGIL